MQKSSLSGNLMMRLLGTICFLTFFFTEGVAVFAQTQQGYVLQVQGRLVFLDLGEQDNVHPDDFLQVLRHEAIIHPVTGEDLGGDVPLGTVRIVQVFPRLSTAEVIDLDRKADLDVMDREAREGLIRVRPLPMDLREKAQRKMDAVAGMPMLTVPVHTEKNPDGAVGAWVTDFRFGLGSRVRTATPDSIYQLISDLETFESIFGPPLNPGGLRGQADQTGINQKLAGINDKQELQLSLVMPRSRRLSALLDVWRGGNSLWAIGARYYPGPLVPYLGDGKTPDGEIGEPAITLIVGRGGRGSSSLTAAASALIRARGDLVADSLFIGSLDSTQTVFADSLFRDSITDSLRRDAESSLEESAKRGFGFGVGLSVPLFKRFTIRAGLMRFGNVDEISAGLTYYMKTLNPAGVNANPDGMLRSLIASLDWRWDREVEKNYLDLNLRFPFNARYTFGADVITDLGGFTRYGVSLKGYIKGF